MPDLYPTSDERRDARRSGWLVLRWTLAIIVIIVLIGWGLWALGVGTSDVKGRGDAIKNKNSGTNRVAAQERFESLYAEVTSSDQKIDVMAAAVKASPGDTVAQTNLTGVQNYCIQAVADYNAEARKYSAKDFRPTDVPAQIDNSDPATDCKENSK
jgi:cytoskeletal protein RodZ